MTCTYSLSVFVATPVGFRYHIRGEALVEFRGDDVLYLHRAGDSNAPVAYIKLEPGMIVTFGSEPPAVHDGRGYLDGDLPGDPQPNAPRQRDPVFCSL